MNWKTFSAILAVACLLTASAVQPPRACAQPPDGAARPQLTEACACAGVADGRPRGRSVVFSAAVAKIHCYTDFSRVPAAGYVVHRWYFRDQEITQIELAIHPPRWATYSAVAVAADQKGPWRVDVVDQSGGLYGTVRFSVLE